MASFSDSEWELKECWEKLISLMDIPQSAIRNSQFRLPQVQTIARELPAVADVVSRIAAQIRSRLHEQHRSRLILGQSRRYDGSGGARADDDDVETAAFRHTANDLLRDHLAEYRATALRAAMRPASPISCPHCNAPRPRSAARAPPSR